MSKSDRDHIRIRINTRVFIEVLAADDTSEALLAQCDIIDVSYGGFSARIETEVPVNAILPVCVEMPGVKDPFFMAAEVMWCGADTEAESGWQAGFKLLRSHDTDIDSWRALLEHV